MTLSADHIGATLIAYRSKAPLVQCLTNIVAANWTANALLASGASPAMVDNPYEAGLFAGLASGVLINTGTPNTETVDAMRAAVEGANAASTPWVLDPVAVGALPWRTEVAAELITRSPVIVRGNASEISGLSGSGGGRGVDATHSTDEVLEIAKNLATRHHTVVAVSGPVDLITDGERVVRVANGHELMTRVTGVGCALGALMAGFASATGDALLAAASATALLTVAADRAVVGHPGPGTFAVRLIDELTVSADDVVKAVRLS